MLSRPGLVRCIKDPVKQIQLETRVHCIMKRAPSPMVGRPDHESNVGDIQQLGAYNEAVKHVTPCVAEHISLRTMCPYGLRPYPIVILAESLLRRVHATTCGELVTLGMIDVSS